MGYVLNTIKIDNNSTDDASMELELQFEDTTVQTGNAYPHLEHHLQIVQMITDKIQLEDEHRINLIQDDEDVDVEVLLSPEYTKSIREGKEQEQKWLQMIDKWAISVAQWETVSAADIKNLLSVDKQHCIKKMQTKRIPLTNIYLVFTTAIYSIILFLLFLLPNVGVINCCVGLDLNVFEFKIAWFNVFAIIFIYVLYLLFVQSNTGSKKLKHIIKDILMMKICLMTIYLVMDQLKMILGDI